MSDRGRSAQRAGRSGRGAADQRQPTTSAIRGRFREDGVHGGPGGEIVLVDGDGRSADRSIGCLPADAAAGLSVPRAAPLVAGRASRWSPRGSRLAASDRPRAAGRRLPRPQHGGVRRGEIKKLLVLETLPKPMNYTGGMEPLSYGGTFTLERDPGHDPRRGGRLGLRRTAGPAQPVLRGAGRERACRSSGCRAS